MSPAVTTDGEAVRSTWEKAALAGADIATMPFAVLMQLFDHPLTGAGQKRFGED
jgi:transaldolase